MQVKINIPGGLYWTVIFCYISRFKPMIIPQGDGTTAVSKYRRNLVINHEIHVSYQPNQNYIDPLSGAVYQYRRKQEHSERVYP
jgi:hypothetical protein